MSNVATGLPVIFYTYVTGGVEPSRPEEGETWYDTLANESKVYDGASWVTQNIESHGALSGVNPSDHHARYTDDEASAASPVQSVMGMMGDVTGLVLDEDLTAHANASDTHHSRYTDDEARSALQGTPYVQLDNIEFQDLPAQEAVLAWDNSEGLKFYWNGSWRQIYSQGSTSTSPNHDNLRGISSDDHHSRPNNTNYGGRQETTVKAQITEGDEYDVFQYVERVEARGNIDHEFYYGVDESGATNGNRMIDIDTEGTHQIGKFITRVYAGQYAGTDDVIEFTLRTETTHNHSI